MGIRDTSYYGWRLIDEFSYNVDGFLLSGSTIDVTVTPSGTIFACGIFDVAGIGFIRKKGPTDNSFSTVFLSSSQMLLGIEADLSGKIYAFGQPSLVASESNPQSWSSTSGLGQFNESDFYASLYLPFRGISISTATNNRFLAQAKYVFSGILGGTQGGTKLVGGGGDSQDWVACVDVSGSTVYYAGADDGGIQRLYRSTNDGTSWTQLINSTDAVEVHVDKFGNFYFGSMSGRLYSGSQGQSNTSSFVVLDNITGYTTSSAWVGFIDSDDLGNVYVGYSVDHQTSMESVIIKKTGYSGSIQVIDCFTGSLIYRGCVTPNGDIYVAGSRNRNNCFVRHGKLTANSASLGPKMLATSFGYVASERSGSINPTREQFKLNNVSEFPHGGGLFQMKNMVLGSTYSGKIGTTDDSIIQVNHIGSVVKVLWPTQDSINAKVKGFGDFSAGERPGKLSTEFQPGESIDVTEYDHVALYCYLSKEVSGTLDDVVLTIERKPLTDNAFTIEQSVDYSISGSKTEARLRDIEYKKEIDYGDLSISKIGFPIDIPLTNTKILRVSARHRVGQTELNKNFIVWGRFIRSSKDTNET